MGFVQKLNDKVENSIVGKYFDITNRRTSFTQELRGGLVCFLTVCYILPVNAGILADSGGICLTNGDCPNGPGSLGDDVCQACLQNTKTSLISATAAACIISHFLMGVLANLPLAICPAMGINALFTYTAIGFMGTGSWGVTYQQLLAAVFVEGWIFIAISLLGIRGKLIAIVPTCILYSTSAGIGLFLSFIGMQQSEGLGVVTYNAATLVTLGGCPPPNRVHQFTFTPEQGSLLPNASDVCAVGSDGAVELFEPAWVPSGNYACTSSGIMRSATTWLGICSGMLMVVLMAKNVKGAMMLGILFCTIISWIPTPSNAAAYIGDYSTVPGAKARTDYFKKVATVPNTAYTAGQFDWSGFDNGNLWQALVTFLYIDFLDATGTFFSMANFLGNYIPNFIDEKTKAFPRSLIAYCVDGLSIVIGSCLGTSPLTVFIESASGIREGARTGIAALTISFCFFIALWFSPLIAAIPPYATGPALILVGALMMINITKVRFDLVEHAVPAFLTIAVMPLTYSISYGLIAGIFSYMIIHFVLLTWNIVQVKVFPKTFRAESLEAADGNPWKAAWHATFNPAGEPGRIEYPDTEATLRTVTFKLHEMEKTLTEAGIPFDEEGRSVKGKSATDVVGDVEAAVEEEVTPKV